MDRFGLKWLLNELSLKIIRDVTTSDTVMEKDWMVQFIISALEMAEIYKSACFIQEV